jgi:hypothetical protein
MQKACSKCQTNFECKNDAAGCWCEEVVLAPEQLNYLKNYYNNCLCPSCLKALEKEILKEEKLLD